MPSFCIYAGEPVSEAIIMSLLQNYKNTSTKEIDGEPREFLDKVSHFELRANGDISFVYQWDASVPVEYRDAGTSFVPTTYFCYVKIIRREKLYFFMDHKNNKTPTVASKLSIIIYGNKRKILAVRLSSELIKSIEELDSLMVNQVKFDGINARDRTISISGVLSRKLENGTRDYSEVHTIYGDRPKIKTEFVSISKGLKIKINKKYSSVTLMKLGDQNPGLDDVASYITELILPRIAS